MSRVIEEGRASSEASSSLVQSFSLFMIDRICLPGLGLQAESFADNDNIPVWRLIRLVVSVQNDHIDICQVHFGK